MVSVSERLKWTTQAERNRCIAAARTMARDALQNHMERVDWAKSAFMDIATQSDGSIAVAVVEKQTGDRDSAIHQVLLISVDTEGAVEAVHDQIQVETNSLLTGVEANMGLSYLTTTKTVLDGVVIDVQPPLSTPVALM